jgi:chromosome condensin MukBEF ATPase and DNA-binding subunit MukB
MTGSVLKNLRVFTGLCGQEAMPNVILATTMWSKVDEAEGKEREDELKEDFWKDMVADGCKTERFLGTHESAWHVIGNHPQIRNAEVLLPRELVDEELHINETQAGIALNKELEQLIKDRKDATRMLAQQAKKQGNELVVNQLNQRKAQIDDNINRLADQLRSLKVPFSRKVVLFFSRKRTKKGRASIG